MDSHQAQKFLHVFHTTARTVPAYKNFLKRHSINPAQIKTFKDFGTIPLSDKKGYLWKYPLEDFFPDRTFPPMVYASSGSSGKPTYWFRGDAQEEVGGRLHEIIFRDIFGIKKNESTLVIICFSMGVWIAGNYTLSACRWVARQGYAISTITPGIEREDIFNTLKNIAPRFHNVILAGYPPFLMDVVSGAHERGIRIRNKKVKFFTAGDKITEEWRDKMLELLQIKDPYFSSADIYGSADAAMLGHETPLSIFLRREARNNKSFYKTLFGDAPMLPSLVQYHEDTIFFEKAGDELVFTTNTSVPLIRYNIHDTGNLFSYEDMIRIIRAYGLLKKAAQVGLDRWKLPFVAVKGRTDVAVTFYALNIFPENIRAAIEDRRVSKYLSGNFITYNKTSHNQRTQKLHVEFELAKKVRPNGKIREIVKQSVLDNFRRMNMEFRKLYAVLGNRAEPVIKLIDNNNFHPIASDKGLVGIKGKKPRVML